MREPSKNQPEYRRNGPATLVQQPRAQAETRQQQERGLLHYPRRRKWAEFRRREATGDGSDFQ
jgi:hypothetical protein